MVAAPIPPPTAPLMERARPAGLPGSQQLRIPTPQDLERMRRFRQQQQQQRRVGAPPPPAPQRRAPGPPAGEQPEGAQQPPRPQSGAVQPRTLEQLQQQRQAAQQQLQQQRQAASAAQKQGFAPRPAGAPPPAAAQRRPAAPRDDLFARLADEYGLEEAWRPQVLLLHELGLRGADFERLAESRVEVFQMGIVTMRRKLRFLQDAIGLSNADLAKVVAKFPRILEYKSERTLRPRIEFLTGQCGVAEADLAKVIVRAPMALELRVKDTLAPRAAYLRATLCLNSGALGKLVTRHPQLLTCTEDMMQLRVDFLLSQGLRPEEVGRAALAHPQVLHYKIDSMRERVDFLLRIGLEQAQVATCIHRFPQLFSLNVEANLEPKWRYLCDYMRTPGGSLATLASYPAFFSLSLTNRVVPRHRFFLHCHAQRTAAAAGAAPAAAAAAAAAAHSSAGLVGLPDVPFPYGHLKCSDAEFVKHCGSTLEDYEAFKARLFEGPVK